MLVFVWQCGRVRVLLAGGMGSVGMNLPGAGGGGRGRQGGELWVR